VNGWERILGNKRYSNGFHEWTTKIVHHTSNSQSMIGVAPFGEKITTGWSGWYFMTISSTLYSGPPMNFSSLKYANTGALVSGSTVKVRLNMNTKTISFVINGVDCGVAYSNIPVDIELCLSIMIFYKNDSVEII